MSAHPLDRDRLNKLVSAIFADDLHAKRVASLANAAVGVLEGAALGIGPSPWPRGSSRGMRSSRWTRLLSNSGVDPWRLFASWVPFVVAD